MKGLQRPTIQLMHMKVHHNRARERLCNCISINNSKKSYMILIIENITPKNETPKEDINRHKEICEF